MKVEIIVNSINKLIEDTTLLFYHYAIEQGKEYYSKKKNYYLRKCAEKETKQAYQDNYIFSTNEDGNKNILKPLNFSRKSTSFLNSLNQKNSNNNLIVKIGHLIVNCENINDENSNYSVLVTDYCNQNILRNDENKKKSYGIKNNFDINNNDAEIRSLLKEKNENGLEINDNKKISTFNDEKSINFE